MSLKDLWKTDEQKTGAGKTLKASNDFAMNDGGIKTAVRKNAAAKIIPEETSRRITSLRFLLSVFVVFIHANLKADDALNYYHYDFIQPAWIEIFKNFICSALGGAAVPLFFFFASYLQFSKNDGYGVLLKKRGKSILLPYVLWTSIAIFLFFMAQAIPQASSFFQNDANIIKNWKVIDWLKSFTYFRLDEGLKNPFVYQFWFLRDLMIFILISPILKFLCKKFSGFFVFFAAIVLLKPIPLFFTASASAFFYYLAGYYCAEYKIDFFKISDKLRFFEYALLLALSVVFGVAFDGKYSFSAITTFISCLFFLKISKCFISSPKLYRKLECLSGFSFFLYAVHTPFLGTAINKLTQRTIPLHGILCLVQFLLAGILTAFIGTLVGIILKKICPKLFALLTGGRV